jgi:flagellar protein FliJ
MSWTKSLIKLSTYEVEVLQKRLGEIQDRRQDAELRLTLLDAEAEAESAHAKVNAEAGWYKAGWLQGLRARRDGIAAEIAAIGHEEAGARDALAQAFEDQKKYEHVAENQRLLALRKASRLESAAFDEMGLRRVAVGGR